MGKPPVAHSLNFVPRMYFENQWRSPSSATVLPPLKRGGRGGLRCGAGRRLPIIPMTRRARRPERPKECSEGQRPSLRHHRIAEPCKGGRISAMCGDSFALNRALRIFTVRVEGRCPSLHSTGLSGRECERQVRPVGDFETGGRDARDTRRRDTPAQLCSRGLPGNSFSTRARSQHTYATPVLGESRCPSGLRS